MADDDDARTGNNDNDQDRADRTDDTDWKAEARKWERRAKENDAAAKAARAELDKLKQSSAPKSDLDKLRESVEKLTERAEKAEREALIADIAREYGLSKKQAARLRGKTREELEADAEDLAETFGIKRSDKDGGGKDGDADNGDQGGDDKGDTSGESRPDQKNLKDGTLPRSGSEKSGEELADEVWKRTHGEL